MAYLTPRYFDFFKKLAANNHKDWFDENRNWYETEVKAPFEKVVDNIISAMAEKDKKYAGLLSKNCIFRINKDVRFSKDKSPYKLNRSALIAPGGKKDMHANGFYFEIGPETCAVYGGVYMPDNNSLIAIRNYIANNVGEFNKIISNKKFIQYFSEVRGEKAKRIDVSLREVAEKQPLLYNKQFYLQHEFDEKIALGNGLTEYLLEAYSASIPFGNFMDKALQSINDK
jgi:uncharacterized protein (TIGR02453 family)